MDLAEDRLARMLIKDEIHEVLMQYCRGVDRCDEALIADCYHAGSIDDHGDFIVRGEDAATVFSSLSRRTDGRNMHLIGNCTIEVESSNVAFAESYFVAMKNFTQEGETFLRIRSGRYLDRFECRDRRWRIAERAVIDEWSSINKLACTLGTSPQVRYGTRNSTDVVYAMRRGPFARNDIDDAETIKAKARL